MAGGNGANLRFKTNVLSAVEECTIRFNVFVGTGSWFLVNV